MKVPMKWLKEYTEINLPASEYADKMVMAGNGVEGIDNTGDLFDKVVVGHVLSCEGIEGTHLHLCMVDVGEREPVQIVCGAPNVCAGAWVCAALDGAHLPGGVKIKQGKLRGYVSHGMLCSGPELDVPAGLYPHCGEEGIILLNEEYKPGTDVKEVFGLGDDVVDFEILANRPDCLSVWGLARESSAVLEEHFVMPEIAVEEDGRIESDAADAVVAGVTSGNEKQKEELQEGLQRSFTHKDGKGPKLYMMDVTAEERQEAIEKKQSPGMFALQRRDDWSEEDWEEFYEEYEDRFDWDDWDEEVRPMPPQGSGPRPPQDGMPQDQPPEGMQPPQGHMGPPGPPPEDGDEDARPELPEDADDPEEFSDFDDDPEDI